NYAELAQQEINGLRALGPDAWKLLGVLAAAGGALSVPDIRHLTGLSDEQVGGLLRKAQRSLHPVGPTGSRRYAFPDDFRRELQSDPNLTIAGYRAAIDAWAEDWRGRGWRDAQGAHCNVPRYLLDAYPDTLRDAPERHARLVGDAGWVTAA